MQLLWSDSDQIDGQLVRWRDGRIQLETTLFTQPIALTVDSIETVRFASRTLPKQPEDAHRLTLVDGSVLLGKHIESDRNRVRFLDYRLGELSFDAAQVVRLESNEPSIYVWNGDIRPWKVQAGQWAVDSEQRLHTSAAESKIWLPLELNGSFAIEFDITSRQSLDFVVATGENVESGLRLARIGESWIIGTADDFEIVEALDGRSKRMSLKLAWDASNGKLSLWQNDKRLVEMADQGSVSQRSGILLQNLGSSFTLQSLRVIRGDVNRAMNLPVFDGKLTEHNGDTLDRILWKDGSKLWCTIQECDKSIVSIRIDSIGQTANCNTEYIAAIQPRSMLTAPNSKATHKLQQGQSRLVGFCNFVGNPPQAVWNSPKLQHAATINTQLPSSVHRVPAALSVDSVGRSAEVARFQSGAAVPCTLNRADQAYAWLSTPFTKDAVQVTNAKLRAIELMPKQKKPNFTKESRELLLAIPRNLEIDHFSHALIGQNGDLLRGNLVAINQQSIEIDSRLEPMLIERQYVNTLLFLHAAIDLDKRQTDRKSKPEVQSEAASDSKFRAGIELPSDSNDARLLYLQLSDGYSIHGHWLGGDTESLQLQSPDLGQCRVRLDMVQDFHFGLVVQPADERHAYYVWNTKSALAPRWKAPTDQTSSSSQALIGTAAPAIALPNLSGETVKLADHHGKVVVIDFWATWCSPCVAALPRYIETLNRFADNEVVFYGINSTESPESVRDFIAQKKWPEFDTLFDYDGQIAKAMLVSGIPHTVVIGRDGKIAHVQVGYSPTGAEELHQAVEKLLD